MVTSPYPTSSLPFYSSKSLSAMPIKSLSSALKASKISGLLLLRNSQDPIVSSCVRKPQSGTWKNGDAISSCENDIIINEVCGNGHIIGMALVTPPYQKSLKTNPQKITRDISEHHKSTDDTYTPMPCPKLSNCSFRISGGTMDKLCSARLFLGLFDHNAN